MFHFIFSYIAHLLKSFHLHGIHSPFVFQLEKKCLKDSTTYTDYLKLSQYRNIVNASDKTLHIEDHGAGSRVFKTNHRKVKDILRHNCSTQKDAQMLYRICNYFKVNTALELGTSLGIATHAMAIARPDAMITTVEGSPEVLEYTAATLLNNGIKNVNCIGSTFKDFFNEYDFNGATYDLIYIDGHHDGTATLNYFETILDKVHNDSVVIFDDIYWSTDMTAAWNKICAHSKVTASVDCFDVGMIFFRKEQLPERFYIKL